MNPREPISIGAIAKTRYKIPDRSLCLEQMLKVRALVFPLLLLTFVAVRSLGKSTTKDHAGPVVSCPVVIVGGSTAAVAAAIASAQNQIPTCLIEPTDWPGGQITAEGVPEIDFAWQVVRDPLTNETLNVPVIDRDPINVTPSFQRLLAKIGNPGRCFVSPNCFPPKTFLETGLFPLLNSLSPYLRVFYNTVIKSASISADFRQIEAITAITRSPSSSLSCGGWDVFLSQDLSDWYSPSDSSRFTKTITRFEAEVFIDATSWGELLVLSGAHYLQGIEERFDGDHSGIGNSTCGQVSKPL